MLNPHPTADGYEFLERIGSGTHGVVYRVVRAADGREAALKVIAADLRPIARDGTDSLAAAFEREVESLSAVRHRYVVRILGHGTTGHGVPYIVTDYVPGEPLDQF